MDFSVIHNFCMLVIDVMSNFATNLMDWCITPIAVLGNGLPLVILFVSAPFLTFGFRIVREFIFS